MAFGVTVTLFCIFLSANVIQTTCKENFKIVETAQGFVKGYLREEVFTFYGVSYATVPKGNCKFKEPLPAPVRNNTFEATERSIACPQALSSEGQVDFVITEECLVANLFLPDTDEDKLPVIVLIHGGAFGHGYGNKATPFSIVKEGNVIFISFNYRLSAYGFLCLGTEKVPGNQGLKDVISLLKWVNINIANFGGNPDDVTVTGWSAGATLTTLLMVSEAAQGLYSKVILESSSSLSSRGVVLDPVDYAIEFAEGEGFDGKSVNELEEFYLKLQPEKLRTDNMGTVDGALYFAPCVEQKTSNNAVLVDAPFNLLQSKSLKKVPVLISITDMEGLFRLEQFDELSVKMNSNFSEFLPRDLQFKNQKEKEDVASKIKEFYFGEQEVGKNTVQGYIDYFTDSVYGHSAHRTVAALLKSGHEEVYLYYFKYSDTSGRGAGHAVQATAVYDETPFSADESHLPDARKRIKKILRDILLNFVKNRKPVPSASSEYPAGWPPVSGAASPYMEVTLTPRLRQDLLEERFAFWDQIYEDHLRLPVPPPNPPASPELSVETNVGC